MSQKAPKEQIPQYLAELVNRQNNVKTIALAVKYLSTVHVAGPDAVQDVFRCFSWLSGVSQGEEARIKELRDLLPDQDTEISLEPEAEPSVSVGSVELQKGEPVLG